MKEIVTPSALERNSLLCEIDIALRSSRVSTAGEVADLFSINERLAKEAIRKSRNGSIEHPYDPHLARRLYDKMMGFGKA